MATSDRADKISWLRSLFLSFSDRPRDRSHVHEQLRRQYRDLPPESRSQLGRGVLDLFRAADAADAAAGVGATAEGAEGAAAASSPPRRARAVPRLTWASFHRVCAAIGLHLSERRGQAALKQFAGPDSRVEGSSSGEAALSFDDFMILYAGVSKPLSVVGELREVWRLLDEDLDGRVPLRTLRTVMLGLERVSPSNTPVRHFLESNYQYHYTDAQQAMTSEQLVDSQLRAHFAHKDFERDSIDFTEFCQFMQS